MKNVTYLFAIILLAASCSQPEKTSTSNDFAAEMDADTSEFIVYNNPPAEGFDLEGSDLLATLLADKTMQAMGGREAWDNTRYLSWNFFGRRKHLWDKWTGDIRIEVPEQQLTILMNINSKAGQVKIGEEVLTDSVDYYLEAGYSYWVNDSYWLIMPYKLKDSGVTLKYLREDTTQLGARADVIGLSFKNVGLTPQNRYEVWVDADSKLVTQWAFYPDSESTEPRFITPWADYQTYGDIMLSGNRGQYELKDIAVSESVSPDTFTSF